MNELLGLSAGGLVRLREAAHLCRKALYSSPPDVPKCLHRLPCVSDDSREPPRTLR